MGNPTFYGLFAGFKNTQVRRPAEKLFMADVLYIVINEQGFGPLAPNSWSLIGSSRAGIESNYDIIKEQWNFGFGYDSTRSIAWRHNNYANVLFFDGHVAALCKDEIYS